MAILIKRYANRKLYNTETSRYITLKGIATLLDEGEEVRVIDKETGEDITQVALSQILVDNQRAREDPSDTLLTQILSRGGDALYGALKRSVDDASEGLGEFQDRFKSFVDRSEEVAKGRGFAWEDREREERRSPFAGGDASATDGPDEGESGRHGASARAGETGPASTRGWPMRGGLPDFREAIQSAIGNAFDLSDVGDFPRRRDFEALNKNLDRVADAIDRLEATIRERENDA